MKLYLNTFLVVFICFNFFSGKRTEEIIQEEDGTTETVIAEEWGTETHRGHWRGRGDIIVVMTNDNDNQDAQVESGVESNPKGIKEKTVPVIRLYNDKIKNVDYTIDQNEQGKNGFTFDAPVGRIVLKREDFPECADLVPITYGYAPCGTHGLVAAAAPMRYLQGAGAYWLDGGIIGYGVLEAGKCGANTHVRSLWANNVGPSGCAIHFQTSADIEFDTKKKQGYGGSAVINFYLWEENDSFIPQPRPHSIDDKTVLLNRIYNPKLSDFDYTTDRQQEVILTRASSGYRFEGTLGRVVTKQSDLADCSGLVSLTKMYLPADECHVLAATASSVSSLEKGGWKNMGVIGFGVLENGKCGASVKVRHVYTNTAGDAMTKKYDLKMHIQTKSDAEYLNCKRVYYVDGAAPTFYIWEA
jgi:hypothetical protein